MEDPMDAPGALRGLEAEFELVRELGRGGSAVVYLAVERELGREVAIKTVHPVFAADPDAAARLVREARTLGRLQHPNIVTFYGVRRLADGGLAMVMQYVRGERLKDRIRAAGPLPVEEARKILADIARALVHAHRHHVVHRDIKPENIYLDADVGLARLSDFGIARLWDQDGSLTQAGLAIGTPAYMAPEQIDGGVLDARSDIYSLGLVAHEMLSGQRPWDGQNLYGIIYRQKNEALPPIAEIRPDVPADLAAAIEKALAKQPEQRWPDADAFLAAILGLPAVAAAAPPTTAPPFPLNAMPLMEAEAPDFAGWEDDAPTIPYRPSEVVPPGGTAGEPAQVGPGLPGSDETAHMGLLAEAERALAELEATAPPPRFRVQLGRRQIAIAASLLIVVAGGLGTVTLVRARSGRTEGMVAFRWSAPRRSPAVPAVPARFEPAPVRPSAVEKVQEAPPRRDRAPAPLTAQVAVRDVAMPTPPKLSPPLLDTAPARSETPAPKANPRLIGRPIDVRDGTPRSVATTPTQPVLPAVANPARLSDIEAAPIFTPFTIAPELRNRARIAEALAREYPRLRSAGSPEGRVLIWLLLDEEGAVRKTQLKQTSGNKPLDEAALRLGNQMRFTPAIDRDRRVPIWVSVPVDFVTH